MTQELSPNAAHAMASIFLIFFFMAMVISLVSGKAHQPALFI
jgi:hypothetical protein